MEVVLGHVLGDGGNNLAGVSVLAERRRDERGPGCRLGRAAVSRMDMSGRVTPGDCLSLSVRLCTSGCIVRRSPYSASYSAPPISWYASSFLLFLFHVIRSWRSCGDSLFPWLRNIAAASLHLGHWPSHFKESRTIITPKPGKTARERQKAKGWRPIALLSTVGKAIEAIVARRLANTAEENHLLPEG